MTAYRTSKFCIVVPPTRCIFTNVSGYAAGIAPLAKHTIKPSNNTSRHRRANNDVIANNRLDVDDEDDDDQDDDDDDDDDDVLRLAWAVSGTQPGSSHPLARRAFS